MRNLYRFFVVLGFILTVPSFSLFAQVGINTDNTAPDNSAMLDVKSANKGLLPPRMTHAQMNTISNPANGLIIYCSDCSNSGNGALAMFISGAWYMFAPTCIVPIFPSEGIHVPAVTQITWNWNIVADATGYKWNTINDYGSATDMVAATTKTETGLTCNTAYSRYAWAYNACGNSTPVTLTQSTSLNPPATPTAGTHVPLPTQITWNWNTVADATGYKWNTINVYGSATDMVAATTITETGLTCNTAYTRYAWAYSACGNSTPVTLTQSTSLDPPATPTAGTHVPLLTQITWNWNAVAGATGYKWSSINDYGSATDMLAATTKTETGLTCNTAYTRYAWAYSACGNSMPVTLNQTTSACGTPGVPCTGTPTVTYGGQVYNTVQIGTQCWFKENLNIGTKIIGTQDQTDNSILEKYCYNNDEANCTVYGGLYQWAEMVQYLNGATNYESWNPIPTTDIQGICPTGWHIPANAEWTLLETFLGGPSVAGGKMKETGLVHWLDPNVATNSSGFTILGCGHREPDGLFYSQFAYANFWSSTENSVLAAWSRALGNWSESLWSDANYVKSSGYSVRCIKNNCTSAPDSPTSSDHVPTQTQIIWNWNPVAGATGYKWDTINDYSSATDMVAATTKTETGLTCNTAYTRYAWAYNGCGNSTPVTLTQSTSLDPPATPTAGTHVPLPTQITWNWNTVADATGYKWSTIDDYGSATDMVAATTKTETGLTCNTAYTRYAWAYSACGNSTPVTLTQSTSLDPPATPTAGTHVPLLTQITWNWNTVAGATGYKWNTINDYGSATDMVAATTKTETGLTCNTAYTRFAWAYNDCGNSTPVTLNQTTSACGTPGVPCTGTPTVTYGGQVYNTVQIGTQCWFKENLNIGTRINGGAGQTNNSIMEKYCYNDLESNCNIYGGLYQWNEMMQYVTTEGVQGICPTDWHIPTDAEWSTVTTFLGGTGVAGGKMKSTGTIEAGTGLWYDPNTGATNESGFTAVPPGARNIYGSFNDLGSYGYWWSSTKYDASTSYNRVMYYNLSSVYRNYDYNLNGFSVRCLRDF